MSAPASVRLEEVTKRYPLLTRRGRLHSLKGALLGGELWRLNREEGGFEALKDVSFEVAPGETVGVIGPNGSGKSTLLKLVAGILRPSSGTVDVRGRVTALIELGAGFHPEISGRDNALVNGMMLGLSKAEVLRRLPGIVEFSGIGAFIDQPVKTYSSGMYVRLGFAVAVAVEPDVLVVDEILAVGDEAFAHRCLDRIAQLQRQGTAILLVSHDLGLVEQLADRALYLRGGSPVLLGTAGAVVARYRSDVASEESVGEAQVGTPRRWGNGDVTLDAVELVDRGGRPVRLLSSGEAAGIRLAYTAKAAKTDFVFGIAISREDGVHVFGTNTELDGWTSERLDGSGEVVVEFPALELAPGRYLVDAAVHSKAGLAYDYACEALAFTVAAPVGWPGSYAPRHAWVPRGPAMRPPAT
ncbi:MAG TPA: ABC transporter ATP-binding protein [Thermoanaerobaculaceae bacterium]|nr:ABC transporter ATP-binding protein [Thermoanaerobaculaceae bacterium]